MEPVKNAGSAYINTPRDADDDTKERVKKGIEFFKKNKVMLAISVRNEEGGYTKYTGFFNGFKKKDTDPDIVLRPTQASGTKPTAAKKVDKDDMPF